MARLMILVGFIAAEVFAKRIATTHAQLQKQGVANGLGIVPGSVQMASPLRPAVMPRSSVPVGMAMQEGGNPGKYPVQVGRDWEGLDTSPNVWMSADGDEDGATEPDIFSAVVELTPEEVAAAAGAAEKKERYEFNVGQAIDSLSGSFPTILAVDPMPMFWDIYTDDLETDFTNVVDPVALALFQSLFSTVAPAWLATIQGKDVHKVVLQELRVLIENFAGKAEVTGQDWCVGEDASWCMVVREASGLDPESSSHEGEQVITYSWKTDLKVKPSLQEPLNILGDGVNDETITVQALSKFHLNDEGKVYRHAIDQLDIHLNEESMTPEDAKLLLVKLVDARVKGGF